MSQNDEILREEFQMQVTEAYSGVQLDSETKDEYKQKIFAKEKRGSARNKYFKVAAVMAAVFLFVATNIAIITLNMRHGRPAEEVTGDTETIESGEYVNELLDAQVGDVLHTVEVKTGNFVKYDEGFSYSQVADYTVQVVLTEIAAGNTPEIDAKINNHERITGNFMLRVVDAEGVVHGEISLSSGAVSEYGLSLPLNSADLSEMFMVYDDVVAFRHLMNEENGQKNYLTTFYGVDVNGNIFHYELNEDGQWNDRYMSQYDMVTSENFALLPSKYGTFRDYYLAADAAYLMYYGFNEETRKISVYMNYSGMASGPEMEAAQAALEEKCAADGPVLQEIFLSEMVEEVSANAYWVYAGIYNYSEEKLIRVYMLELGGGWTAQKFEEIEIDSLKSDSVGEQIQDQSGTFDFWAYQFIINSEYKVSSPWPQNAKLDYMVTDYDDDTVEILFYAWTSEPHVSVFKNTIEYNMSADAKSMSKVSEELTYYDAIDSADEFFEAYPGGVISGTRMDYLTNGYGLALNENALKNSSGEYSDLFDPATAAAKLLNIDLTSKGVNVFAIYGVDSSGVTVCIEFEKTGKKAYVKMIKPFGGDGIWIPQSEECNYEETVVNVIKTDLTHDGIDDYIVTSIRSMYGSEKKYTKGQDVEEFFYNSPELCYVRVYSDGGKSTENTFDSDDCIWWREFATARPGNGFVVLVEDSGKNYLMTGMLNEQQGTGDYKYEVLDLGDLLKNIDWYSVGFATENPEGRGIPMPQEKRSQVVPDFRTHIEKWFDNATLIVAFDLSVKKGLYITNGTKNYKPENYFDNIWAREDDY